MAAIEKPFGPATGPVLCWRRIDHWSGQPCGRRCVVALSVRRTNRRLVIEKGLAPSIAWNVSARQEGRPSSEEQFRVSHEPTTITQLRHVDGMLSLAKREAGTATAKDFFICIGDQPELDAGARCNPGGPGFAAFGRARLSPAISARHLTNSLIGINMAQKGQ